MACQNLTIRGYDGPHLFFQVKISNCTKHDALLSAYAKTGQFLALASITSCTVFWKRTNIVYLLIITSHFENSINIDSQQIIASLSFLISRLLVPSYFRIELGPETL